MLPQLCVHIFSLWSAGRSTDAMEVQQLLSAADWVLTKTAIPGTKAAIQSYYGYGGYPRRPLGRLSEAQIQAVVGGVKEAMEMEATLKDVI